MFAKHASAHHGRDGAMTSDNDSMFGEDDDMDIPRRRSNKKRKRMSRFSSYHNFRKNDDCIVSLNNGGHNSEDDVGSTHGLYEGRKQAKKSILADPNS